MKIGTLAILLIFVAGCGQLPEFKNNPQPLSTSIIGSWRLANLSGPGISGPDEDKLLKEAREKEILQQGILLTFFEDGTFTEMKGTGEYTKGSWHYSDEEQELNLTSAHNADTLHVNQYISKDKLSIGLISPLRNIELKFIKHAHSLQAFREDPFYPTNNRWRVKPARQETPDQLEERLANYFQHLAYLLKAAKERNSSVVSFEFSQGLVKIYNGGIGIQPPHLVPKTWKNAFYNEDDASATYRMFERYLQTTSYKGGGTGKWIEDDYNILLSIYGDIRQGKFLQATN